MILAALRKTKKKASTFLQSCSILIQKCYIYVIRHSGAASARDWNDGVCHAMQNRLLQLDVILIYNSQRIKAVCLSPNLLAKDNNTSGMAMSIYTASYRGPDQEDVFGQSWLDKRHCTIALVSPDRPTPSSCPDPVTPSSPTAESLLSTMQRRQPGGRSTR